MNQPKNGPGYRKNPEHCIQIQKLSGTLRILYQKNVIATTENALLLEETSHDDAYYVPINDINMSLLVKSPHKTYCPFKGEADYWTLKTNGETLENVAWGYLSPYSEVHEINNHLSFYPNNMEIIVNNDT